MCVCVCADVVRCLFPFQVFESHAGLLGPKQFEEFSLLYLTQIAHKLRKKLQENGLPSVPMVG